MIEVFTKHHLRWCDMYAESSCFCKQQPAVYVEINNQWQFAINVERIIVSSVELEVELEECDCLRRAIEFAEGIGNCPTPTTR